MQDPDLRWLATASGAKRTWPHPPAARPQRLLQLLGATPWPAALALIVGLGLLLAFQQVVSGAVRQGELRRLTVAMALQPGGRGELSPSSPLAKPVRVARVTN